MSATIQLRMFSRRSVLAGSAAVAGTAMLGGCPAEDADTAELPLGLSPLVSNEDFYVTSCCGTPTVDVATWSLQIRAGGVLLGSVDYAGLEALPARDREHTLECISAGPYHHAIGNTVWSGVPLRELLDHLGVSVPASAVEMKLTGADGYTTSIPVADLDKPVWIVWRMHGEPLPPAHGTTARLLVPGRYGMKNPKWLVEIDFIDEPYIGYWEGVGWSNTAEYLPNTLIQTPVDNLSVPAGPVEVLGTAFAGSDAVTGVLVSVDGGATWADAELTYQNGPDVWVLWRFRWEASPGEHRVQARCRTASGAQSGGEAPTASLDGWDGSMVVDVTVTT